MTGTHQEQIDALTLLQKTISQSLARLRAETDNLQRMEETIRAQQENLQANSKLVSLKQNEYRVKGMPFVCVFSFL